MQIVIEIPNEEVPNNQEIIDIYLHFIACEVCECNYPYIVLPKGHGKLGDLDIILNKAMKHRENYMEAENSSYCRGKLHAYEVYVEEVENAPTIIEADKEYEAEVITRGKCMMCGKELTDGLFFCKECGDKANSEK